ncbi:type II secretion system protein [Candidatus Daviesbacteria bacterium]|nr:type II secretion system protein [Candidatus Daviesbacteria bacterium]
MKKLPVLKTSSGFTLIELMVVITIIAFLSVIGIVSFTNAQKQARDGRRRADVESIATALESNRSALSGTYKNPVTASMFANNSVPTDPSSSSFYTYKVTYSVASATNVANDRFVVCGKLEIKNGNSTSDTGLSVPGSTDTEVEYYCRASQQ